MSVTLLSVTLLKLLSDGEYHSGDALGAALGVSRTAVWKQLKKLEALELPIESIKGKGYRLVGGLELLDEQQILKHLTGDVRTSLKALHLLQDVPSTNAVAMEACQAGDASGVVWLAERQTAGRGRRGRDWQSPFGRNIYLSVVWGFPGGAAAIEGLSLAVGVGVRRGIERCGITGITFKWPNDLLYKGRKVGGILLEMTGDPAGFCQVVIGIGLNVGMGRDAGKGIDQPWDDLSNLTKSPLSRNLVAGNLLRELLPLLSGFGKQGFAAYREEWQSCDSCRDKAVTLVTANSQLSGIARGVTETGALRLEVEGRITEINGGEVSLRHDVRSA